MPAILDQHGRPYRLQELRNRSARQRRAIRAKYDAAQTSSENIRHWSAADTLSPDAANSEAVRKTLRSRGRYEYLNNAYCRSIVETLAADVIGTGPRLQVVTGAGKPFDTQLEGRFTQWARAVRLAAKLRSMRRDKCVAGAALGLLTTKRRRETPVTLNLRPIEVDRLAAPWESWSAKNEADGIRYDSEGEPTDYYLLRNHPGGIVYSALGNEGDWTPASEVIHLFRADRSEQHHGIPELTPALPLFAILRRYSLAELLKAENSADITGVLESTQPETAAFEWGPSGTSTAEPSTYEAMDAFDIERNMVLVMPDGTKVNWLPSQAGATGYAEFKREILAEAFAAVVMPYNVGAHDSSEFNYASGKLDRLTYSRIVDVERFDWEVEALAILLFSWFAEARFVWPEYRRIDPLDILASATWHWDAMDDIDPAKAAMSRKADLESGSATLGRIYAQRGMDADTEFDREAELLGLTREEYNALYVAKRFGAVQNAQQAGTPESAA